MMNDDDPIAREPHVELESVRSKRQAVVERREGVLGPKRRAAPVRIDERTQAINLTRGSSPSTRFGETGWSAIRGFGIQDQ